MLKAWRPVLQAVARPQGAPTPLLRKTSSFLTPRYLFQGSSSGALVEKRLL